MKKKTYPPIMCNYCGHPITNNALSVSVSENGKIKTYHVNHVYSCLEFKKKAESNQG